MTGKVDRAKTTKSYQIAKHSGKWVEGKKSVAQRKTRQVKANTRQVYRGQDAFYYLNKLNEAKRSIKACEDNYKQIYFNFDLSTWEKEALLREYDVLGQKAVDRYNRNVEILNLRFGHHNKYKEWARYL